MPVPKFLFPCDDNCAVPVILLSLALLRLLRVKDSLSQDHEKIYRAHTEHSSPEPHHSNHDRLGNNK